MIAEKKKELLERVDEALNDLRPHLAVDGGDVEVVDITDDMRVKIRWLGNCVNCSMSAMTLKAGVEQVLKQQIPGLHSVEPVNEVVNE